VSLKGKDRGEDVSTLILDSNDAVILPKIQNNGDDFEDTLKLRWIFPSEEQNDVYSCGINF
jgi:hypothetical protein